LAADRLACCAPPATTPERLGRGRLLGEVTRADLDDTERSSQLVSQLAGSYLHQDADFAAPYFDVAE
jgi:hypothetical protein